MTIIGLEIEPHNTGGWIRILGYGWAWHHKSVCPNLFSERNKHEKYYHVFGYHIRGLEP